uniref:ATP synthase F0 subunit 8 n=1 Tax=Longpotamon yangtsekiense TaxID=321964 RepID=A0A343STZ0_9EUCA|nr:ATP synthase F0 subunit 8 [Longpotamon yangtsekiense]AUT13991.1 ATP synthase F0 subunit 8 [Longpotamon yangtsekiense]
MPQMFPMFWLSLLMFFLFSLTLFLMLNYFIKPFKMFNFVSLSHPFSKLPWKL